MAQGKQALKSRIRTIQATKKITNAMELIATSKLKKQKQMMEQNREYAFYLKDTVQQILAENEAVECVYLQQAAKDDKPLTILFTSDMGLCGGYNTNMMRYLEETCGNNGSLMLIGSRGVTWLKNRGFHIINEHVASDNVSFLALAKCSNEALNLFVRKEITSIRIVFTRFVNAVSFSPEVISLLPVKRGEKDKQRVYKETIFEPNPTAILNDLIPMYVRSLVYSYWLETKTSEQASRRMAMESATDNAQELIEGLVLQFNQARQAAITQEISEIVAGADAL